MRHWIVPTCISLALYGCSDGARAPGERVGASGGDAPAGGGDAGGSAKPGSGGTPVDSNGGARANSGGGAGVPGGSGAGRAGAAGAAASTGGAGGAPASGGAGGTEAAGGSAGAAAGGGCAPGACGTHRYACWPMPNTVASGLANPAHYTDLGDGTVRDDVTCLVWEKTVSSDSFTVADARTHCASRGAGFRVATRIELASIDDVSQSGAKTDPTAFPGTPRAFFKTGSEWVLTTKQIGAGKGKDFGWAYNFSDGIVSNARSGATPDRVRCVKGGGDGDLDTAPGALAVAPLDRYETAAPGEVHDKYTGLVWQQATSDMQMPWSDAAAYCKGLALNGHAFRLASLRELATLVDESQVAPAIDRTQFPGTKYGSKSENWYWAAERQAGSSTAAWAINFDDGFTGANGTTDTTAWNYFTAVWVRCVR